MEKTLEIVAEIYDEEMAKEMVKEMEEGKAARREQDEEVLATETVLLAEVKGEGKDEGASAGRSAGEAVGGERLRVRIISKAHSAARGLRESCCGDRLGLCARRPSVCHMPPPEWGARTEVWAGLCVACATEKHPSIHPSTAARASMRRGRSIS